MNEDKTNQYLSSAKRILYLDILRGIAIFFIFLVNIQYLSGTHYYSDAAASNFATAKLDYALTVLIFTFINGKFYYLFSILFGIGFAIQYQNVKNNTQKFTPFFRRRMMGLLVIGGVHMIFIWSGDILTLYALLGMALIWFRCSNDQQLLRWVVVLFAAPIVHWLVMYATGFYYYYPLFDIVHDRAASLGMASSESLASGLPRLDQAARIHTSDIGDWFAMQTSMPVQRLALILREGRIFKVLGLFILGLWAGRQVIYHNLLSNKAFLKRVTFWGLIIGLPLNVILAVIKFSDFSGNLKHFLNHLFYALGVAPLACAYAAGLALVYTARPKILNWLAPVGQTALSNYLFQSIIAIFIFNGIGLGYAGVFGFTQVVGMAILIFIWQVLFSTLWLRYFKFGPIEWIWRQITYGKFVNPVRNRRTT